jgi:hypothetical protein
MNKVELRVEECAYTARDCVMDSHDVVSVYCLGGSLSSCGSIGTSEETWEGREDVLYIVSTFRPCRRLPLVLLVRVHGLGRTTPPHTSGLE